MARPPLLLRTSTARLSSPTGLSVTPGDYIATGEEGGPFVPATATYYIRNDTNTCISWTAAITVAWLDLFATSGTLGPGESSCVVISFNASANALTYSANTYDDTLTISGGGYTVVRVVQLTVSNPAGGAVYADHVTQYGITWTFDGLGGGPDGSYQVGQFVNGDWWVVGPVGIASVDPAPAGSGATYRNGTMVDPLLTAKDSSTTYQGYDGRCAGYDASYSATYPLSINPGASSKTVISTESIPSYPFDITAEPDQFPQVYRTQSTSVAAYTQTALRNAAVLTVVSSEPAADAFRPPMVGTIKPIRTVSELNLDPLTTLVIPANAPILANLTRAVQRPWIDYARQWYANEIAPINNQVSYGRDVCYCLGDIACMLCCDYTDEEKRASLYGLIQIGIDAYHAALLDTHLWTTSGGYKLGRKFPILFAGLLLEDAAMKAVSADFQEDMATYYGADRDPVQTLWTGWAVHAKPYVDVGSNNVLYQFEEGLDSAGHAWDHEHVAPTGWDDSPFPNNPLNGPQYPWDKHENYRRLSSFCLIGQTMAVRILGLRATWAHQEYFDYVDRWMNEDDSAVRTAIAAAATAAGNWNVLVPGRDWTNPDNYWQYGQNTISAFQKNMYTAYRSLY